MNEPGTKLTTYFSERRRSADGRLLAEALFDVYERHRVHTSVLLRGVEGFGQRHHMHSDAMLTLSEDLPAVSVAVDTRERIERTVPDVLEVADSGLVSLERAQLVTGPELSSLAADHDSGRAIKLTLYGGRSVRAGGQTGYVAAVELLRRSGFAGASVLLAVDGTLQGERRRARFFARNANVPLMLLSVGSAEAVRMALPGLAALLTDAVATIERVQVCKLDGRLESPPTVLPARDEPGLPVWQKVMIHAEEQAHVDGHALHRVLVRRLLAAGAAGATVLRGVRGFYAGHAPFADRALAVRRNVPVHVVVVDTPENLQRLWPIIDAATRDAGLVTSELVPALHGARHSEPLRL